MLMQHFVLPLFTKAAKAQPHCDVLNGFWRYTLLGGGQFVKGLAVVLAWKIKLHS
jgi:hypothetical protein